MNEIFIFVKNNIYNLRSGMHLSRVNVHSTQYGTESIGNLGEKIWNLVPVHINDFKALGTLKNQIKKWIPKDCPCRLCKVYVAQVDFLQKLLRLFAVFSGIQHCLFYSSSFCFILFYFIYFFNRFLIKSIKTITAKKMKKYNICVYVFVLCIC